MRYVNRPIIIILSLLTTLSLSAQDLEGDGWKLDLGLSYLATTGNSETSSFGFTSDWEKLVNRWHYRAGAQAFRAEEDSEQTAERYAGYGRADWSFAERLAATGGWQGEQNRFAGIDHRSTVDLGLSWDAVEEERWTVDTVSSATWTFEDSIARDSESWIGLLLMARSTYEISENATTTQMLRLEPNLEDTDDFRADAQVGLTANITDLLGVKLAYEVRYDAQPVSGFDDTDTLATVSLVMNLRREEGQ